MNKYRDQLVFEYKMVFPNYRLVEGLYDATDQAGDFFISLLRKPLLENGSFSKRIFKAEKNQLIDDLQNLQKNPSAYAHRRCVEMHFEGTPFGIYKYGSLETAMSVTRKELLDYYYDLLEHGVAYFYRHGDFKNQSAGTAQRVKSAESLGISHRYKYAEEQKDLNQSLLVQAYVSDLRYDHELINAAAVGAALFGGDSSSLLFKKVREELSYAYYIYSKYDKYRATMFVNTGFSEKNFEELRTAIAQEFEKIRQGAFTDDEFAVAKLDCELSMVGLYDRQMTRMDYEFLQDLFSMKQSIEERIRCFRDITREEVMEAFRHFELVTEFHLKGTRNEEV